MKGEWVRGAVQITPQTQGPILCVDESRATLENLSAALRHAGFATTTATDGGTAIALCSQTRFSLAIIGCVVSDGSGVEVMRQVTERGSVPAIFLATHPTGMLVNLAANAGAMCVLVKPVELPELLPAVQSVLLRRSEVEQLRERVQRLEAARQKRSETGIVIGLLTERLRIPSHEVFEGLRRLARERQRKISDVAAEILRDSDNLLMITRRIGEAVRLAPAKRM